ncbi:MAG: FAD-dependent oxidoreductase [Magnetococcus sp. WYHC-3]
MRVTVVGSGFGALAAVRTLRHLDLDRRLDITLVSPRAELVYLPSLIWVPTGLRQAEALRLPLGDYLRRLGVRHVSGSVAGVEGQGRVVRTRDGQRLDNDALILACGAAYLSGPPGQGHTLNPCAGPAVADQVRSRYEALLNSGKPGTLAFGFSGNPQEPTAVRGGPMFEFLFGIERHLRRRGDRQRLNLVFYSPMERPGQRLGPQAVERLLATMARRGIATHLGAKILRFDAAGLVTERGRVDADLTLFLPGLCGQKWFAETGFTLSPGGFFQADAHGHVTGAQRVWVAGDAGSFPGPEWRPKQGHMAELQAVAAAGNLWRELTGRGGSQGFRTELICIVDGLDRGMLVARYGQRQWLLPDMRALHWAKRAFEWWYTAPYR